MDKKELIKFRAEGVRQWEIAEKMGIREEVLSRKLRHELSAEDEARVRKAIDEILLERGNDNATDSAKEV